MDSKSKNEDEHPAYASVRDMTYFTILLILDNIWGTDFWKPDAFPVTKLTESEHWRELKPLMDRATAYTINWEVPL